MLIDREHVRQVFAAYTASYDPSDVRVDLKIKHTYRVASLCEWLARQLSLSQEDSDLAWLLGMLHDIGRFEQLRRYHTFRDAISINHAALGADILFQDKLLFRFLPETACAEASLAAASPAISSDMTDAPLSLAAILPLAEKAIRLHNVFALPDDLTVREKLFCDILRDADKNDILRVNYDTPMTEIYDFPEEAFLESAISDEVFEDALACRNVLRSHSKTPIDFRIGHIALVFGLVFPESLKKVQEQGYLEKLMAFPTKNPETDARRRQIRDKVHTYFEEKSNQPRL